MAPVPEAYFASLDKCFSGDAQLLSWERVFLHLCDLRHDQPIAESARSFLQHAQNIRLLSNCLAPFPPPSPASKTEFESKTAAIHVNNSPNSAFKLDEIKADALWLSQQAGIDEVTALRITVLEWQSRPNARLLGRFSEEEVTSLQDATGVDKFRVSLAGPQMMDILKNAQAEDGDNATDFVSEKARRLRLRHAYLSERVHILKTARQLRSCSLRNKIPCDASWVGDTGTGSMTTAEADLQYIGEEIFKDKRNEKESRKFLQDAIRAVESRLKEFQSQSGWLSASESDDNTEITWRTALMDETAHIMQLIFLQLQSSDSIPDGDLVRSWLKVMSDCAFMEAISIPCEDPVTLMLALQAMASATTLAFLKLPNSMGVVWKSATLREAEAIADSCPYFFSRQHITEINEMFLHAASSGILSASPGAFAWGTILHTMRDLALSAKETLELEQFQNAVDSFQSNVPTESPLRNPEQTFYEELLNIARIPSFGDDFVAPLTAGVMDQGQLFEVIINLASRVDTISGIDDLTTSLWIRSSLLAVIRVSSLFLDYSPEIVGATLAILNGSSDSSRGQPEPIRSPSDPRYIFLKDDELMDRIFRIARSRFPYESIPFLKLCRALTGKVEVAGEDNSAVVKALLSMETFTQMVSPDFQGYETIREDENANFVSLIQPLPLIPGKEAQSGSSTEGALIVASSSQLQPATTGQVVSESKPAVIMWYHEYSGLGFLGACLEEWANTGGSSSGVDEDAIAEIIDAITDLMTSSHEHSPRAVLEKASDELTQRGDIISIVFDIFERSLQSAGSHTAGPATLERTISCLRFMRVLLSSFPNRVWPFLSRSSLLGPGGQGGRMTAIISACEVTSGDYPFLLGCIDLFSAIIEDIISRAALRRTTGRSTSRDEDAVNWSAGVPSHVLSHVLLGFTRVMVEAYNSNANWRFNEPDQRLQVDEILARCFENIVYYAHGIDEAESPSTKITGVFHESASYILTILRPQSIAELPLNPVLRIIIDGLQTPMSTVYVRQRRIAEGQLTSTLKLAVRLIQAGQLLSLPTSLLESQLFKAAPVLVKLYASRDRCRLLVVTLLDLLVSRAAADSENEPPSLLGHLGAETSCHFLDVLAQFDKPLSDTALYVAIWRLLSTFVSKRQQWLAVYLLTGSSPRESLKKDGTKAPAMRGTPFLKTALDSLANIGQIEPETALALLEFVSHAQEHWPWATPHLRNHPSFFSNLVDYVAHLKLSEKSVSAQIYLTKIAATTADLCAVYLHSAKQAKDSSFVKTLVPLVAWYTENAVDVAGYNASLHANLKKNFEKKYSGSQLRNFKRTALEKRPLGGDYYYDMYLAEKMLSFDNYWSKKNKGYADELERANYNLSLVEAQVSLFNSWKFFAIEHAADFIQDKEVQRAIIRVVKNTLVANTRTIPQEAIFNRLQQSRVEFALALLQKLVEVRSDQREVYDLLQVVWDAMRARGTTYENALIHEDTVYYRSLLNVLFLALQFHVTGRPAPESDVTKGKPRLTHDLSIVQEVVKVVVAQGFRSLTTHLHDEPHKVSPRDFVILTAILQTALRVKYAERLYDQIVFHMEDNDAARYATTLYSWSDQLTVEGDPIYGELSLLFMVELSTIPMLAEYLAVEGVLMKLSSSRLTRVLSQPKGHGPFDAVPRLYAIWAEGFLPLCLNLLYHVSRAAPEVAAFLNQFEGQLRRAADSLAGAHVSTSAASTTSSKKITLSMASEIYSLSLISFILQRYREAGPSTGLDSQAIQELRWDRSQVKEDIEELLGRRASLRSRIVATNDKELEMLRQKPAHPATSSTGAENRLEEKIVEELSRALVCLSGGETGE